MYSIKGRIINLSKEKSHIGYGFLQTSEGYYKVTYDRANIGLNKGDLVEIEGEVEKSKGLPRITVDKLSFIAKNEADFPNRDYFANQKNQTNRHLDLMCNPDSFDFFKKRNEMVRKFREYLWTEGFDEVDTGILKTAPYSSKAESFATFQRSKERDIYLRKTTEIELKKLLIGGFQRVFEVGKLFRNEGKSKKMLPEFTCFDLLMAYSDYQDMGEIAKRLFQVGFETFNGEVANFESYSFEELLKREGFTPSGTDNDFRNFNSNVVKTLQKPTIVYNFPHTLTPLAKKLNSDPRYLEDFKICYNGMGVMHGHSLETSLKNILAGEKKQIDELGVNSDSFDLSGQEALKYGIPPSSGLSLGIERILLALSNRKDIKEVTYFPLF